jgi:hypothetical protein
MMSEKLSRHHTFEAVMSGSIITAFSRAGFLTLITLLPLGQAGGQQPSAGSLPEKAPSDSWEGK